MRLELILCVTSYADAAVTLVVEHSASGISAIFPDITGKGEPGNSAKYKKNESSLPPPLKLYGAQILEQSNGNLGQNFV